MRSLRKQYINHAISLAQLAPSSGCRITLTHNPSLMKLMNDFLLSSSLESQ